MAIRRVFVNLIFIMGVFLLSGCGNKPVVGVILPATGSAGQYGESIESGVRLAVSVAREKGKLPVDFDVVWADSESDPDIAVREFRRLVEEKNAVIILGGATSEEARALIPVMDELQTICISPSASAPGLSKQSKYFYRIYPSDELEGQTAGKFIIDRLKAKRVLLLVGNSQYAEGIEAEFEKEFIKKAQREISERIDLNAENWDGKLRKALRNSHDPVYIIGYSDEIVRAILAIRKTGFKGRIVTTSAFYISKAIQEAGDMADGVLFPLPPFDRNSQKEPLLSFVHRYMETYERPPDVFSAHGYDAMDVILEILRETDPIVTTELTKELHFGLSNFTGVTGPILFNDFGDVRHYPKMFIYKESKVQGYQHYLDVKRRQIINQVQNLLISSDETGNAGK